MTELFDEMVTALIADLEQADGPSRELDARIQRLVAGQSSAGLQQAVAGVMFGDGEAPPYTASIDAALTLVPKRWGWIIGDDGSVQMLEPDWRSNPLQHSISDAKATAATPALVICIAALRAREAR